MDLVKQSAQWRKDATELLELSKITEVLERFGTVTPTGSYVYDLMLGADIDLFVSHEKPSRELAEDMTVALTKGGFWNSIMFCDWQKQPGFKLAPGEVLPFGDYFCVKKDFKGTRWKVDIFLVDPKELQKNLKPRSVYASFSDDQKKTILALKDARAKGQLPADISSAVFYDMVLKHNVKGVSEFKKFAPKASQTTQT